MAKQNTASKAPAPPKPTKKIPGIKIIVTGQIAQKGDRRTDLARYEEIFYLPEFCRKEVLYIVKHFLVGPRMEKKDQAYRFVRTCGIKSITITEDTGLGSLFQKAIEEMTPEEIRTFVIINRWPLTLIDESPIEFDLMEKVAEYAKNPKQENRSRKSEEAEDKTQPGMKPLKEGWEELDK